MHPRESSGYSFNNLTNLVTVCIQYSGGSHLKGWFTSVHRPGMPILHGAGFIAFTNLKSGTNREQIEIYKYSSGLLNHLLITKLWLIKDLITDKDFWLPTVLSEVL